MKVHFVFMTRATVLMVHLIPDVMYVEAPNGWSLVFGWLNMHLAIKFYKKGGKQ